MDLTMLRNRLLLLVLIYMTCTSHALFSSVGTLTPNDPMVFVGENLTLDCNLTNQRSQSHAADLYFTNNGRRIDDQFVEVIDDKSVRLHYPIGKTNEEGTLSCWQNKIKPVDTQQRVNVDYRPKKVEKVTCIAHNWDKLTCTWDLGVDYQHKSYVCLIVRLRSRAGSCENKTKLSYEDDKIVSSMSWDPSNSCFGWGHNYSLQIKIRNTVRKEATVSSNFHISTRSIVKPSPVSEILVWNKTKDSVMISAKHQDHIHSKTFIFQYSSEWSPEQWINATPSQSNLSWAMVHLTGLTPFTWYKIRVAVKPSGGDEGFPSDWNYTDLRTQASVPEVVPKQCTGCYQDMHCSTPDCRTVRLFWQPIPLPLRNSQIESYRLDVVTAPEGDDGGTCWPEKMESDREEGWTSGSHDASLSLSLSRHVDSAVQLFAITAQNKMSHNCSRIFIPALDNKPKSVENIIVDTDSRPENRTWSVRWSDFESDTASFTVVWCQGHRDTRTCLPDQALQWQEVDKGQRAVNISIAGPHKQDYIFGVTRQALHKELKSPVSSGITWAPCIYRRNVVPWRKPDNFGLSPAYSHRGLQVTWTWSECSDVFITHFVIVYCPLSLSGNGTCHGQEQNQTADGKSQKAVLADLTPDRQYRVKMAAVSQWGQGPFTPPRTHTVDIKGKLVPSSNETRLLAILIPVCLVILLLVGCVVWQVIKYCKRTTSKFGKTIIKTSDFDKSYVQCDHTMTAEWFEQSDKQSDELQSKLLVPIMGTPENQTVLSMDPDMDHSQSQTIPLLDPALDTEVNQNNPMLDATEKHTPLLVPAMNTAVKNKPLLEPAMNISEKQTAPLVKSSYVVDNRLETGQNRLEEFTVAEVLKQQDDTCETGMDSISMSVGVVAGTDPEKVSANKNPYILDTQVQPTKLTGPYVHAEGGAGVETSSSADLPYLNSLSSMESLPDISTDQVLISGDGSNVSWTDRKKVTPAYFKLPGNGEDNSNEELTSTFSISSDSVDTSHMHISFDEGAQPPSLTHVDVNICLDMFSRETSTDTDSPALKPTLITPQEEHCVQGMESPTNQRETIESKAAHTSCFPRLTSLSIRATYEPENLDNTSQQPETRQEVPATTNPYTGLQDDNTVPCKPTESYAIVMPPSQSVQSYITPSLTSHDSTKPPPEQSRVTQYSTLQDITRNTHDKTEYTPTQDITSAATERCMHSTQCSVTVPDRTKDTNPQSSLSHEHSVCDMDHNTTRTRFTGIHPDLTNHLPDFTASQTYLTTSQPDFIDTQTYHTTSPSGLTDNEPGLTASQTDLTNCVPDLPDTETDLTTNQPDLTYCLSHRKRDLIDCITASQPSLEASQPERLRDSVSSEGSDYDSGLSSGGSDPTASPTVILMPEAPVLGGGYVQSPLRC